MAEGCGGCRLRLDKFVAARAGAVLHLRLDQAGLRHRRRRLPGLGPGVGRQVDPAPAPRRRPRPPPGAAGLGWWCWVGLPGGGAPPRLARTATPLPLSTAPGPQTARAVVVGPARPGPVPAQGSRREGRRVWPVEGRRPRRRLCAAGWAGPGGPGRSAMAWLDARAGRPSRAGYRFYTEPRDEMRKMSLRIEPDKEDEGEMRSGR